MRFSREIDLRKKSGAHFHSTLEISLRFAPFDSIHKFFIVPLFFIIASRMTSEKNSFNLRLFLFFFFASLLEPRTIRTMDSARVCLAFYGFDLSHDSARN